VPLLSCMSEPARDFSARVGKSAGAVWLACKRAEGQGIEVSLSRIEDGY
jgi:hypothetical protein